ncbi:unnamed protein product [Pieris macdunnoughi]|uniref:Uncharacterized protein n=1 Tax=Pieris macdunnoughi TaxID=345717 RepID=A0A821MC06_9NEOP|nr:unnamed protein product [Pieris macdunnoughi]
MKLVSTVLLSLFFVVITDARFSSEMNYQDFHRFYGNRVYPIHPSLHFRYSEGNSNTKHKTQRVENTECQCPCPKNEKYEQETITLMTHMLAQLQQISLTLQQPIKFQMDKQNTMEDNSKVEEETQQDNTRQFLIPVEESLPKVNKKFEVSNHDDDVVNESKNTKGPRKVAEVPEEPEDNIRPISFLPVNIKTSVKQFPLDHGSKFY